MKRILLTGLLALAILGVNAVRAADPAPWPEWRTPMIEKFTSDLQELDAALATSPDSIPLLSQRGDRHLFLGHFPQAVADFERTIAIDPAQDAPHWRLGIAYYFPANIS